MPKISVRKSKRNPDFYIVKVGSKTQATVIGKTRAQEIAAAAKRAYKKRIERMS